MPGIGFAPLAILKKLVVAFENEEDLIFILMGVGRGTTAGGRGLNDGGGAAVCHFARDKNLNGLAENREDLCVAQERSFHERERQGESSQGSIIANLLFATNPCNCRSRFICRSSLE